MTVMTMQAVECELTRIEKAEEKLAGERLVVVSEAAAVYCPLQVGQEVDVPSRCIVYAGKRCRIRGITLLRITDGGSWRWVVRAQVLRKDGTVGVHSVRWTWSASA